MITLSSIAGCLYLGKRGKGNKIISDDESSNEDESEEEESSGENEEEESSDEEPSGHVIQESEDSQPILKSSKGQNLELIIL